MPDDPFATSHPESHCHRCGGPNRTWWVTTGRKQDNGKRVLGPFDTRELALEVRTLAESAWDREGAFWVVTGHEIPERSITPGFFRTRATA